MACLPLVSTLTVIGIAGRQLFARLTILLRSLSEASQPTIFPRCIPFTPFISSTPISIVPPPLLAKATRSSGFTDSASRLKSTFKPSDRASNRFVGINGISDCFATKFLSDCLLAFDFGFASDLFCCIFAISQLSLKRLIQNGRHQRGQLIPAHGL